MLAEACPGQSARTWDLLRTVLDEGFQSIDRRLQELGPLQPDRFSLKEANARLSELALAGGCGHEGPGGGRLPKRRRGRTTPAGPDDRAAGTGDGNAWHEFDRGQSVVGRRAGFCSRPAGTRRVGATTCLSTLPQAVYDQGLRQ